MGKPPPRWDGSTGATELDVIRRVKARGKAEGPSPTRISAELRELMWTKVGAFRTADDLATARERIHAMRTSDLDQLSVSPETVHNASLVEWFELRNGLQAAEAVSPRSTGAKAAAPHQRVDFPQTLDAYQVHQTIAPMGRWCRVSRAGL